MNKITRRDFINGTLVATGASLLSPSSSSQAAMAKLAPSFYPPALTGLRGSHPGSNTHAHARAWTGKSDWGPTTNLKETYDLIVVGGGISGLSAAYFYQQKHGRDKKVLILDNHDDFGGHAKRNEHTINGKTLIGYGGSQTIQSPYSQSKVMLDLLKDIGIDLKRFETAYDRDFYKRHHLGPATYFNKESFGEDKVVRHPYCSFPYFIAGLPRSSLSNEEAARQAPLSEQGKRQLLRVLNGGLHEIEVPKDQLAQYTRSHSYFDYLKNTLGVDDPGILKMARHSTSDWAGIGSDVMNIRSAKSSGALGFPPSSKFSEDDPYIHHFPDGNAGVARALVKKLIPDIASGANAEELILSKFDYPKLDSAPNSVRIRLNSTAVKIQHIGDPKYANEVFVDYINGNQSFRARGRHVIMACYNSMIPHIVSGLPEEQDVALRLQRKVPLQYTSVGLKNWRAFKELGIGLAMCPGNWHQVIQMDFPVSMGGYRFSQSPDAPCIIQMISCPTGETVGAPAAEQYKEVRRRMLGLQFEDYEKEIRAHLNGMLPREQFEFDRDVESITVNRWAHGYANGGPGDSTKIGRQPFGRIAIANSDSAPSAYAHAAIDQAWRAVSELK